MKMYIVNIPNVIQPVQSQEDQELPDCFGPYETYFEAVGQAIELIRERYDDEPEFSFYGFGDHYQNIKMIVNDGAETYLAATINKLG